MQVKENITSFGVVVGILMSSFNLPTSFTPPQEDVPTTTVELPQVVTAPSDAVVTFDKPNISSTPAPVAPVAEPQPDTMTNSESAPTASPVVKPSTATAAKKTTAVPSASGPVAATPVVTQSSGLGPAIAAAALAQLGIHQDCTMLVTNSLAAVGIHYHGWPAGYLSLGTVVPASQAQPGDLAYYANGGMGVAHIAVYIGNGQAVHGGWNGNQTQIFSVNVGSGPVFIRVAG